MNHLRELLETVNNKKLVVTKQFSNQEADEAERVLLRVAPSAMCFSLGDVDGFSGFKAVEELSMLPYDTCWFEMSCTTADKTWIISVLVIQRELGTQFLCFRREGSEWMLRWVAVKDTFKSVEVKICPAVEHFSEEAPLVLCAIRVFLSAMNCTNVHREQHNPDSKLQKARAKKGKLPLFSYWTLQLTGKNEKGENYGGTHASPRLHLRRGHPRLCASGKGIWVAACVVGNKSAGIVHKDYSAGPELLKAA